MSVFQLYATAQISVHMLQYLLIGEGYYKQDKILMSFSLVKQLNYIYTNHEILLLIQISVNNIYPKPK